MGSLTTTALNDAVDGFTGTADPTYFTNSTKYIAMFNGDPESGGTELTSTLTGASTRAAITSAMGSASSGSATNSSEIEIVSSASGGATIDYIAIYSAATAGQLLGKDSVTSKAVSAGDGVKINASGLTISAS